MRAEVHEAIAEIEQSPPPIRRKTWRRQGALLQWMHDDHFTFLDGYLRKIPRRGARTSSPRSRGRASASSASREQPPLSFSKRRKCAGSHAQRPC